MKLLSIVGLTSYQSKIIDKEECAVIVLLLRWYKYYFNSLIKCFLKYITNNLSMDDIINFQLQNSADFIPLHRSILLSFDLI